MSTYNAFHSQYGASSPKILGSYDGGNSSDIVWGQEVYAANSSVGNYVDGWTMHPYGSCDSTVHTGHTALVSQAHSNTGKPIYVTEIGWPTNTGSCNDVTEQQQADDAYNFINWARSTGYVSAVYYFNYRDYGSSNANNSWWGLERASAAGDNLGPDGSKKPAWMAVICATYSKPENCTSISAPTGDLNADGHVDIVDLSILLSHWQSTTTPAYDLNNNGAVDIFDLSILLSHYGS
jgi:hypothetical protein